MATEEELMLGLRRVIDPELGVNVVDLGLIYGVRCEEGKVLVEMTMTTPACPLGDYLTEEVQRALSPIPGVTGVDVDIGFDPPWSPDKMSEDAKRELGWRD